MMNEQMDQGIYTINGINAIWIILLLFLLLKNTFYWNF